ncbi:MAG: endolytic transglycosylase MltG [Eubacteriales bacterium]|nr:endolytic transglycosylase MltG [Eubacteriales bacterium]
MENQNMFDAEIIAKRRWERERRRRRRRFTSVLVLILVLVAVLCGIFACNNDNGIKKDGTVVEVTIEEGSNAKIIAEELKENGLISNERDFLSVLKKSEYANSLRFGVYEIERGLKYDEIIKILSIGGSRKNAVVVTIPEGFSLERIVERLAKSGLSDEKTLYEALKADYDYNFLKKIPENDGIKYRLQGFLFPSTYEFSKDMEATEIINMMLAEFEKQIQKAGISSSDLYRTITLASLVEREAKVESERNTIAGVIENRIAKGMRLQIDASVVYAISDGMYNVDRVLYKDLEVDSPYNTYKYTGLPVGPICSPGIKSIEAAANPEKHNYYYYRVDSNKNDGSHIFTENFEEHKTAAE